MFFACTASLIYLQLIILQKLDCHSFPLSDAQPNGSLCLQPSLFLSPTPDTHSHTLFTYAKSHAGFTVTKHSHVSMGLSMIFFLCVCVHVIYACSCLCMCTYNWECMCICAFGGQKSIALLFIGFETGFLTEFEAH